MLPRFAPALLFALLLASPTPSRGVAAPTRSEVRAPRMIVSLRADGSVDALAGLLGMRVVQRHPEQDLFVLEAPPGASDRDVERVASLLAHFRLAGFAELDRPVGLPVGAEQTTIAFIDSTPTSGEYTGQPAVDQINAPAAHTQAPTGTPVTVAVIDTGLDPGHPVFSGQLAANGHDYVLGQPGGFEQANGQDDDGDGLVDEGFGHGTNVAGLVLLASPDAQILPLRVLNDEGLGYVSNVVAAILYAVAQGAGVINLSLSTTGPSDALAEALMWAEYNGAFVVTSSGNGGAGVFFPGTFDPADFPQIDPVWLPPGVVLDGSLLLTVGAVDDQDVVPGFCSTGLDLDALAPGVDAYGPYPGGGFAWLTGTSQSCGVASGALSFLVSRDAGIFAGTMLEALLAGCVDVGALNPSYGPDQLGSGRIDLLASTLLVID